jgi:DNA (cytosine-5)-methyltransferase 1
MDEAGPLFKSGPAIGDGMNRPKKSLRVAGLFAGIGGIELGLHEAGHRTQLLCEIDEAARSVLSARFPDIQIVSDIRELRELPAVDLVAAGFPCQDLSQAGQTAGINGKQSGLVGEVFRLIQKGPPRWLLLENVPFMLQLDKGKAMEFLAKSLEELGFHWAYRVVDAQCFGLPQRRQRVILLASQTEDPRDILFADDSGSAPLIDNSDCACGFYWTEGKKGLGWAIDAVPTLKGGSTIGIPSPPGIWMRQIDGSIQQPEIRDAERLQGFPPDWTLPALRIAKARTGARWKLVGNAVSVPVARWIGECLKNPREYDDRHDCPRKSGQPWPKAAWGANGTVFASKVSRWPVQCDYQHLTAFLEFPTKPLSERATAGFLSRAKTSCLRFPNGFLDAVSVHLERMRTRNELGS